ncbi:fructosamine kinase family protein [Rhodovulum sp. YNF3179]|uniref:fructosamine kinase family protein n=1 Tax=Rhodovulum sp. YNF3179 TaxID=3425127 RepID=UPI003D33DC4E
MTSIAPDATRLLGQTPVRIATLAGGALSDVLGLELADGRAVVAKSGPAPRTEAAMLRALRAAGAPAPAVIAADHRVLVMERLPDGGGISAAAWGALGAVLAGMHAATGPRYGWPEDYAFGAVAIPNAATPDWPGFWAERRLRPEIAHLPADLAVRIRRLAARLPGLLPATPRPALLHGDLWTGNILVDGDRIAGLVDPACYYGDPEVDLAMLSLFATPAPAFWARYGAPDAGWPRRRAIYQLWPAIVHMRLFGEGYRGLVERSLAQAGA